MKSAKITLIAIAICTILGGVVAFKANRSMVFYFTKTITACIFSNIVDINLSAPNITGVYTTNVTPLTTILPQFYCSQTVRIKAEI